MRHVLTPREMQAADLYTQQVIGLGSLVLMERAALSCLRTIQDMDGVRRVLCVCGRGNNGGDGIAIARLLHCAGYEAEVFLFGNEGSASASNAAQLASFLKLGGRVADTLAAGEADLIVDALFGIGLSRDIGKDAAAVIDSINQSGAKVLAVDIPSGVDGENGRIRGCAVRADVTVTFQYLKRGLLLEPGRNLCGRVICEDIGIVMPRENTQAFCYDPRDLKALLPARIERSNKGSYGKLLIIAGREGMAGAAALCARSAVRCGCGLVKVMSDPLNRVILQTLVPEALYTPFPDEMDTGRVLKKECEWADAVVIGPGLGTDHFAQILTDGVLAQDSVPALLDADALNTLSLRGIRPDTFNPSGCARSSPVVITPHPGEMARLRRISIPAVLDGTAENAVSFAAGYGVICVLKDSATVVSDGTRLYINRSGCDGMATGGSGDVLSGVIGAMLAAGLDGMRAASAGVYLHGLAGEDAQKRLGPRGMSSMDLAEALGQVLKREDEA